MGLIQDLEAASVRWRRAGSSVEREISGVSYKLFISSAFLKLLSDVVLLLFLKFCSFY